MMVTAIRIKLIDLLKILSDRPSKTAGPLVEGDLEAIRRHLQNLGPKGKKDLAMELHMTDHAVLHRLNMLKDRGIVVDLHHHEYGLREMV